jgi:hypothetical protein
MLDMERLLKSYLRHLLLKALRVISTSETIALDGWLRIHETPFENEQEYKYWWCAEWSDAGRQIRAPRMSAREKARYQVREAHNILTNNGRYYLLVYVGSSLVADIPWAQYFAVGGGPLANVSAADTTLVSEIARLQPTGISSTNSQTDVSVYWNGSTGNGTWAEAGFYGINATSSLFTGTLMNHVMFNYNKQSGIAVTTDWILVLNA